MAGDFLQNELILPATKNAQVIKDSSGRCWVLKGLQLNVGNVTQLDQEIKILEDAPCCDGCDTSIFEFLLLDLEEDSGPDIPDV